MASRDTTGHHGGGAHAAASTSTASSSTDACPCKSSRFVANMWTAAHYGDAGRLAHLLSPPHYKPPSVADEYGHTPLHYAAAAGHAECVALLLAAGAAVNAAACGALPLHRAAYGGHARVVAQLLAAGSRVDAPDTATGDGRTPLAKAASNGHAAVVGMLLAAGADAGAVDARGAAAWQLVPAGGSSSGDGARSSDVDTDTYLDALPQELLRVAALPAGERTRLLLDGGDSADSLQRLAAVLAVTAGFASPEAVVEHFRSRCRRQQQTQQPGPAPADAPSPSPQQQPPEPAPAPVDPASSFGITCPRCGALAFAIQRAPVTELTASGDDSRFDSGAAAVDLVCERCASAIVAQARRAAREA
jgi:hypothetical protein